MAAMLKDSFPAIDPKYYGRLNYLRREMLMLFEHMAKHSGGKQTLMSWMINALQLGATFTGTVGPEDALSDEQAVVEDGQALVLGAETFTFTVVDGVITAIGVSP